MEIKTKATQARGALQQGIYAVINPFVRLLIRMGVTPNIVTTIGMLGNMAAAAVLIAAGVKAQNGGGADFGLVTLGGLAFYLIGCGDMTGAVITFLALVGSIMVSYVRARAEGLDIECKIGFMQRPERVVVTSVAALAAGITGMNTDPASAFDPNIILVVAMGIIAVFANLTAFARISHCRRELSKKR